jgi:hypothetical protein
MNRHRLLGLFLGLLLVSLPALAGEIDFDEIPPANDESQTLSEEYAPWGVHFRTTDDGSVWSGLSDGDPGAWGLEGTNGSAFMGFDGASYRALLSFDEPVTGFQLDVSRAEGSQLGDGFDLIGLRQGVLIERVTIRLHGVGFWQTVGLVHEVDQVLWFGWGYQAHPYGVDSLSWVGGIEVPPEPSVVDVHVDVLPDRVRMGSRGVVPVVLFGSEEFAVEGVNTETLAFGPGGAPCAHSGGPHYADVNEDGHLDLVSHHRVQESVLHEGDGEACLDGEMLESDLLFEGCDTVTMR